MDPTVDSKKTAAVDYSLFYPHNLDDLLSQGTKQMIEIDTQRSLIQQTWRNFTANRLGIQISVAGCSLPCNLTVWFRLISAPHYS